MELPQEPTIYDYLVLSLRPRDVIATFNWDPLLFQAWLRNSEVADMPHLAFLHGNVAVGYSKITRRFGPVGMQISESEYLEPTNLLYPITRKDYKSDEFISLQWEIITRFLSDENTVRVTIFGYSAPKTDVEAIKLMKQAWASPGIRNMEQFEIIDVKSEDEVRLSWKEFIHDDHYNYCTNYFDSVLAYFPRRTSESYFHTYQALSYREIFQEPNPIPPDFKTLEEMRTWFAPLIQAEEEWKGKVRNK